MRRAHLAAKMYAYFELVPPKYDYDAVIKQVRHEQHRCCVEHSRHTALPGDLMRVTIDSYVGSHKQ